MNYFGHAVISRQIGSPPWTGSAGYALGAMLPDFASMCGGRLAEVAPPVVAAGVDLHHRTDDVFHNLPAVTALMRELHEQLLAAGCQRGPARAGSHIGVELLLDGVLVEDAACRAHYLEAIAHAGAGIRWHEPASTQRFEVLLERLRQYGAPTDLREPSSVTERLLRVLSRRPRLAASSADAAILATALAGYQARVRVAADTVMRGVLASLRERAVEA